MTMIGTQHELVRGWLLIASLIMDSFRMRIPRTVRPLYMEYLVMGEMLRVFQPDLYEMTQEKFCTEAMRMSGGGMNPTRVVQIYHELMKEAGLKPLYQDNK